MPVCDMCGASGHLVKARIEGSLMTVCEACARFGQVQDTPTSPMGARPRQQQQFSVPKEEVVENYASLIKSRREQLNLNQEDFAKRLNEKISLVHALESGHHPPSIPLARKLEKLLKIKLVGEEAQEEAKQEQSKGAGFTMGDFLKK